MAPTVERRLHLLNCHYNFIGTEYGFSQDKGQDEPEGQELSVRFGRWCSTKANIRSHRYIGRNHKNQPRDGDDSDDGSEDDNSDSDEEGDVINDRLNDENRTENGQVRYTTTQATQSPPVLVSPPPEVISMNTLPIVKQSSVSTNDPTIVIQDPSTNTMASSIVIASGQIQPTLTTFAPLITTGMLDSFSSQPPRKGVEEPQSSTDQLSLLTTTTSMPTTTSGTALANSTPSKGVSDSDNDTAGIDADSEYRDFDKKTEHNRTAEHALIGVGSIGIFILACVLCWLAWRMVKHKPQARYRGCSWKLSNKTPASLSWLSFPSPSNEKTLMEKSKRLDRHDSVQIPNPSWNSPFSSTNIRPLVPTDQRKTELNSTQRSRTKSCLHSQFDSSQDPCDVHNSISRHQNRNSELSSLSSGFGDGDIIVSTSPIQPPLPSLQVVTQSDRTFCRAGDKRETIYTESSEDSPARFRSVNSWVTQQVSRIKRAQQRSEKGDDETPPPVPGLPGIPGLPLSSGLPKEHQYSMMIDFEQPKQPGKQNHGTD